MSRACLLLFPLFLFSPLAHAAPLTGGGVALSLDAQGRVAGLAVGQRDVQRRAPAAPLVGLCDVTRGKEYVAARPEGGDLASGLRLDFGAARASGVLTVAPRGEALHFRLDLQGADLPSRGMLLRFSFPLDAAGWRWHDDVQSSREIGRDGLFENVTGLRIWADMPEWADQPALRMGYSNRNFCTILTGPAGLCLAVPMDRPAIFRTAYDAGARQLQLLYEFALTPDFRTPNAGRFEFDLYACNPAWGFRDALRRYYALYPELFRVHVRDQGQWMAFNRLSEIDNANEFLFALQEGAPEPEYDDKLGVLSATYFTHAGQGANLPDYDPEKDPLPGYEAQVTAVEAAFRRTTGQEGVYAKVGLGTPDGKLDVRRWSVYAHLIAQFNLDPELPYGAWFLDRAISQTEGFKRDRNADLDGFYYDGLSAGINYRADHMKTAEALPLWDPVAKKPFLNNFFSSVEFARAAAERLRPRGQITMMNGALGASAFVMPWLDVAGAETGLRIPRADFNYIRSVMYHKPYLTLLKGNYEQSLGHAEIELFMKRCLAYGVFPGFFDWPPSGLGPGGRYWEHPAYFERDRDLHRRYLPLCRALALAGWEPVTHVRGSNPQVFIERFGPGKDGIAWLTLLNESAQPQRTTLRVDAAALGLDERAVRARDLVSGDAVSIRRDGKTLIAEPLLPADGVMALQIATPAAAAARHLAQAEDAVRRGIRMREIDQGKPAHPVHWLPTGAGCAREANAVVFRGDGTAGAGARQWVMLFQPKPAPVMVRVRAAAQDVTGVEGEKLGIRCRIAWVTRSFSYYENRFLPLPGGTYPARDFELAITSEHPLRAVQVEPVLAPGVRGTLRIEALSVSDASRAEYAVDPAFAEWYEPVPEGMGERVAAETGALARGLTDAGRQVRPSPTAPAAREALSDIAAACVRLSDWIHAQKAENGCRRVLRDIESVEAHLGAVALLAYGITPPRVLGATRAAPGDTVDLRVAAPSVSGQAAAVEVRGPGGEALPRAGDGWRFAIPADARPGDVLTVTGIARLGPAGRAVPLRATHPLTVAPPLTLQVAVGGTGGGESVLRVALFNERARPAQVALRAELPDAWEIRGLPPTVVLGAREHRALQAVLAARPGAAPGLATLKVVATAGSDRAEATVPLLNIPPAANRLVNHGFEAGVEGWSAQPEQIERRAPLSGKASLRLRNAGTSASSQVSQTVTLSQTRPVPILVLASSRAEGVSGGKDRDYSLYVDIYYTDGTPLYGQVFEFSPGTTQRQTGFLRIVPEKPIRNVNVYLLLRNKSGTAWFDDVVLVEDEKT